jgi:hypothetical protein
MEAICKLTGRKFVISDREAAYCRDRGYPLPTIHPNERLKRLLAFRNRTFLCNTTCAFSKKPILSCIAPDKGFTIYDNDIWNSEQWDPLSYGIEYDLNGSFWEQLESLYKKVPLPNLTIVRSSTVNSEYVNGAANLKNCYLTFANTFNEDCMFGWNIFECKNVLDTISAKGCELCYACTDLDHCYNVQHADSASHCSDSYFLDSCKSCNHCYGCVNLSNKQYCWNNQQLSKEEYEQRLAGIDLGNYDVRMSELKKFNEFKKNQPRKFLQGTNNENCSGNYIHNSSNASNVFHAMEVQDVENSIGTNKCKDCFVTAYNTSGELVYNTHAGVGNYNVAFSIECIGSKNLEFCLYCVQGCSDCFGCVGLKKKQYCIFNKQYSKEDYERIVKQIKEKLISNEWQDHLPLKMSQVYYNQSDAMIIFPLTREQALAEGFDWKDEPVVSAKDNLPIPSHIQQTSDDVLNHTYTCELTGKAFRVIKPELNFYRNNNIPLPHQAPLDRLHHRAEIFRVEQIKSIQCSNCQQIIESVYDPAQRPVLCEPCYQQVVS